MKEPWREAFQDRLGDYELDVPVPASGPALPARRKIALPPLLSAAAAAAALLLLLPFGKQRPVGGNPLRTPGQQAIALLADNIPHPQPLSLTRRKAPLPQPTQPAETQETPVIPDTPVAEEVSTDTPAPVPEVAVLPPEEPQVWEDIPEPSTRHKGKLYTQIHAGNLLGSESETEFRMNMLRAAKAAYRGDDQMQWLRDNGSHYSGSGTNNADDLQSNEAVLGRHDNWYCQLPLRAGLSLRYQATPVFGVESGVEYIYQYARETTLQKREARFHYLGIPVKASVRMAQWERLQLYTTVGAEAEWLVAGTIGNKAVDRHPVQYSLMGALGLDLRLAPRLSLYAEPGFGCHYHLDNTIPSYYWAHPLAFDLRAGLRFEL
jgi:hypothetical protein